MLSKRYCHTPLRLSFAKSKSAVGQRQVTHSSKLQCNFLVYLIGRSAAQGQGECGYQLTTVVCVELKGDPIEDRSINQTTKGEIELCVVFYQLFVHVFEHICSSDIVEVKYRIQTKSECKLEGHAFDFLLIILRHYW